MLKRTKLTVKENDSAKDELKVTWIKSEGCCPSQLMETNLFVKTRAYPLLILGISASILNSTLVGWKAGNFADIVYRKHNTYNRHHQP